MTAPRFGLVCGGFLLLAACAGAPAKQDSTVTSEPEAEPPAAVASLPTPPSEPELPPVPDVQAFMNKTGTEIAGVFGEPGFVRRDPPAEMWQYRAAECTLDLFLYDDGYGDYRLAHFDFRGATYTDAARDACLRDIVKLTEG